MVLNYRVCVQIERSDWQDTRMSLNQDKITIYSNDIQIYRVIGSVTVGSKWSTSKILGN